jgi:hypothetical protein
VRFWLLTGNEPVNSFGLWGFVGVFEVIKFFESGDFF